MDYQVSFNVQDDTYRKACISGKSGNIIIDKTNLSITSDELNEPLNFKMNKHSLMESDSVSCESTEVSNQGDINILDVVESAVLSTHEVN